jgi:hypothetical protein
MPIKVTLAYGKNFHFFYEALDANQVYLELEDVAFEVGYRRIMISIPIDIWETIRGLGDASLELVNASDEELARLVEGSVDGRIAEYERLRESQPEKAELLRFNNSMMFGAADEAREQQMLKGLQYYRVERERQREVVTRMAQHKIVSIDSINPDEINETNHSDLR